MSVTPDDARARALESIQARRNFWRQTATFVFVELVLIAIWAVSSNGTGHFWPIWPGIFFVLGTIGSAWRVFAEKPITDEQIQREIDKQHGA
jgi:hypothetical protein